MLALLWVPHWWWHPLGGQGYQWWSGIGSDLGELTLIAAVVGLYRHRNCHVQGCWRLGHQDEHGFPACRKHHSRRDELGVDPHHQTPN